MLIPGFWRKMEIKELNKNEQVKDKMKRKSWKVGKLETRPSKIIPKELAQGLLKRVHSSWNFSHQTHLSK